MDSNGLADPYVKLHLLPGASKVQEIPVNVPSEETSPTISLDGLFSVLSAVQQASHQNPQEHLEPRVERDSGLPRHHR